MSAAPSTLSLAGGYVNTYGGPADEYYYFRIDERHYRPYATAAEACTRVPLAARSGRTVNIQGEEFWWKPTDLTDAGLVKKVNVNALLNRYADKVDGLVRTYYDNITELFANAHAGDVLNLYMPITGASNVTGEAFLYMRDGYTLNTGGVTLKSPGANQDVMTLDNGTITVNGGNSIITQNATANTGGWLIGSYGNVTHYATLYNLNLRVPTGSVGFAIYGAGTLDYSGNITTVGTASSIKHVSSCVFTCTGWVHQSGSGNIFELRHASAQFTWKGDIVAEGSTTIYHENGTLTLHNGAAYLNNRTAGANQLVIQYGTNPTVVILDDYSVYSVPGQTVIKADTVILRGDSSVRGKIECRVLIDERPDAGTGAAEWDGYLPIAGGTTGGTMRAYIGKGDPGDGGDSAIFEPTDLNKVFKLQWGTAAQNVQRMNFSYVGEVNGFPAITTRNGFTVAGQGENSIFKENTSTILYALGSAASEVEVRTNQLYRDPVRVFGVNQRGLWIVSYTTAQRDALVMVLPGDYGRTIYNADNKRLETFTPDGWGPTAAGGSGDTSGLVTIAGPQDILGLKTFKSPVDIKMANNDIGKTDVFTMHLAGTAGTDYFKFKLGASGARGGGIIFGELDSSGIAHSFPDSGLDFQLNKTVLYQGGPFPIALQTNGQDRVTVTGTGSVGVGTDSPAAQFHNQEHVYGYADNKNALINQLYTFDGSFASSALANLLQVSGGNTYVATAINNSIYVTNGAAVNLAVGNTTTVATEAGGSVQSGYGYWSRSASGSIGTYYAFASDAPDASVTNAYGLYIKGPGVKNYLEGTLQVVGGVRAEGGGVTVAGDPTLGTEKAQLSLAADEYNTNVLAAYLAPTGMSGASRLFLGNQNHKWASLNMRNVGSIENMPFFLTANYMGIGGDGSNSHTFDRVGHKTVVTASGDMTSAFEVRVNNHTFASRNDCPLVFRVSEKGMLVQSMTTQERDAMLPLMTSADRSTIIYNTDHQLLNLYTPAGWVPVGVTAEQAARLSNVTLVDEDDAYFGFATLEAAAAHGVSAGYLHLNRNLEIDSQAVMPALDCEALNGNSNLLSGSLSDRSQLKLSCRVFDLRLSSATLHGSTLTNCQVFGCDVSVVPSPPNPADKGTWAYNSELSNLTVYGHLYLGPGTTVSDDFFNGCTLLANNSWQTPQGGRIHDRRGIDGYRYFPNQAAPPTPVDGAIQWAAGGHLYAMNSSGEVKQII